MRIFGFKQADNLDSNASMILLTCLCIGAFLRAYNFWAPDLWLDEYGTWWVVSGSTWTEVAKRAVNFQGQSPLYFFIVKLGTTLFGDGSLQLRLPSVLFGILTLVVALRLALQIFRDRDVTLVALAVFSINEPLIWFSQNARPYALALFLALVSISLFLDFLQSPGLGISILYAGATALLIYAHFLFGFVLLFQVAFAAITLGWRDLLSKRWLTPLALIAVLCLPSTSQIFYLYGRRQSLNWIPHIVQSIQASSLARNFADPWALLLAAASLLVIGIKPFANRDTWAHDGLRFLLLWLGIPLAGISLVATIIGVSFLEPRYILFVYPAAFYLWAWLLLHSQAAHWLRWLPPGVFIATTAIVSLIPNLLESGTFRHAEKLGWREAARIVAANGRSGDLVIFYSAFIEADLFAVSPQSAYVLSYVGWPLIAHLPADHRFNLMTLPFLQNERTDPYIQSLTLEASKHDRVWIVAPDQQRDYFIDQMLHRFKFRLFHGYLNDSTIKAVLLLPHSNRS